MKFQGGDNVEIHSTTSKKLDGQLCRVVGCSHNDPIMRVYLVWLQQPVSSITGHCLTP